MYLFIDHKSSISLVKNSLFSYPLGTILRLHMEAGKKEPLQRCKVSEGDRQTKRARVLRIHLSLPAILPLCADACAVVRIKVSGLRTRSVGAESGPGGGWEGLSWAQSLARDLLSLYWWMVQVLIVSYQASSMLSEAFYEDSLL